jgi:hypothetical protein
MYSPTIRVHLIDTPGFDDTETKESDILRRIAGWLGDAYENKIRLSGLVYLHRITDPRMPGSAKRNLHMFQRVCGSKCLPGVVLVTTMWNIVNAEDGARREKELVETEDFWAPMVRSGSGVLRHQGTERSALSILEEIIRRRHPMLLNLQQQMSVEGKGLEETDAGIKLNEELYEVEKKHKEELKTLEGEKQEALREKDEETARQIAQSQKEYQSKVDAMQKQRQDLEVTMNQLKTDRENQINAIKAELKTQQEEIERKQRDYDALEKSRKEDKETHEKMRDEISRMKEELQEAREVANRKKPGEYPCHLIRRD